MKARTWEILSYCWVALTSEEGVVSSSSFKGARYALIRLIYVLYMYDASRWQEGGGRYGKG